MTLPHRQRRRSVGFIEHEDRAWACYLVTAPAGRDRWEGYFAFRPADGEAEADEVRTAAIFLEAGEAEVEAKARGLGRPLLTGLLASALHVSRRDGDGRPGLRRWFRDHLGEEARRLSPGWDTEADGASDRDELRSLYASYRMDQVAHLIALVRPDDFEAAVERILEGQPVDFSSRDRLQLSMLVVERIEALLPLPPFEVWADDFLAHRDAYRLYAHTLHREGRLP